MVVGICKLDLRITGCRSLKEKRQALKSLKDRTEHKFRVRISEVGFHDLWQRAALGFAVVGNERNIIEGLIQRISNFVGDLGTTSIIDRYSEIINI